MIQIRPGVFETDSSSSHAIVVKKTASFVADATTFTVINNLERM